MVYVIVLFYTFTEQLNLPWFVLLIKSKLDEVADSEIETSRYKYCLRNEHFKVALVKAEYFCTDQ